MKEIHHQKTKHLINYSYIVTIIFSDENNLTTEQKFRIYTEKDYYQFYRLLNERRAFYSLPMIDQTSIVHSRFNSNFTFLNDLMQTLSSPSSILNNITASKSPPIVNRKAYVFDVDKTLKQFYDDIRRYIYHFNIHFDNVLLKNYQKTIFIQDATLHHHHHHQRNRQEHDSVCLLILLFENLYKNYTYFFAGCINP